MAVRIDRRRFPALPARRSQPTVPAFAIEPLESRTLLAVILWDGGGDGTTLTQAANWVGDIAPGAADDAVIDVLANPTITHNAGVADFLSLTCAEAIGIGAGTLTLGAASAISGGTTLLAGSTIATAGDLTFSGLVDWNGGTLSGAGTVIVAPAGSLILAPGGKLTIADGGTHAIARTIRNNGSLIWDADAITWNGAVTNAATGVFYVTAAAGAASGTGTLANVGRLVKQATGSASFTGVGLDNTGSVQVRNGTLTFGSVTQAQGAILAGGTWEVLSSTTLNITGATLTTIGADAAVRIVGATANFAALSGLNRNLGSLEIAQSGFNLTPTGGTFTNEGVLTIGPAVLNITGAFAQTAAGTLIVQMSGATPATSGRINATQGGPIAGALEVQFLSGFVPVAGNKFRVLFAPGLTGTFTTTSLPPAPGLTPALAYNTFQAMLTYA